MAVRFLVKSEILVGEAMLEKSERAKWRGVLLLMVVMVAAPQPGSEKFMFAA